MVGIFQAIGGKFAALINLRDDYIDIDSMITTNNKAVTYLGRHVAEKALGEMFSTSVMRGGI